MNRRNWLASLAAGAAATQAEAAQMRGADLVGTPLTSLGKILAAGDDYQTFNGFCGAESGFVPVSATSPSLLVEQIEVERKDKGQDKPPLLPAPTVRRGSPPPAAGGGP